MKYVGIILLVLVGYFIWHFVIQNKPIVIATSNSGKKVSGTLKLPIQANQLTIQIQNNEHNTVITGIKVSRDVHDSLGLSAPNGFHQEAMAFEDSDDTETKEYVKKFNAETVRYDGNYKIGPNQKAELIFPITNLDDLHGEIDFTYEHKLGFGGSISFFSVQLNPERKSSDEDNLTSNG
ncbi:hypothetical protein WCX18_06945 [Sulfurimonas sp. HSL1-2]|uniref:hypothetical protein n=1 Tax=Thiomicrolovo zhangzhouensis TaxID=3131933 RepID=UPI0031FA47FD